MNLIKRLEGKTIFIVSTMIVLYFMGLYLLEAYEVDLVFIGVLIELLTLPFLVAQLSLFVVSLILIFNKKTPSNVFVYLSILLLGGCSLITIFTFYLKAN
ncbi:hypothetical protein AB832_05470 [Flavobacteriaceae bacterium (ex Bugula neritina AB1)]|nr:hypothetical protein AB832_05470 [Flavobacteriaceae bacterium (ex Bugula neritina AB1)]